MSILDPETLFRRIALDVPSKLHKHMYIVGSLAAAYHYAAKLHGRAVNTKDADIAIHPAGDEISCAEAAGELLRLGWKRKADCYARPQPEPASDLRAIRLYPRESDDYFIEFLQLPAAEQLEPLVWKPVQLSDGWYGTPCFRFFPVTAIFRQTSAAGLEYACPAMMALANLLAHPRLGEDLISATRMRRSAKDLGRVLVLAWLEERSGTEAWKDAWLPAMQSCFPSTWRDLALALGGGLRELLDHDQALEEARSMAEIGLLSGLNVSAEKLRITGQRLLQDVIAPLESLARKRS
jgi:hypothetical protein